jgi:hypothetical protein
MPTGPSIANSGSDEISRRRMLQLVAASLVVVSGCSVFRTTSELEEAREELRALLGELADGDAERVRLLAIGHRINARANELVGEHRAFIRNFNNLAANRDVTTDELTSLVADYEARRIWLRDDLLRLQDSMKAALSADEWERVLDILNRKGGAITEKARVAG